MSALATLLLACGSSPQPTTSNAHNTTRTDAVAATPKKEVSLADFCEQQPNKPFVWPELDAPAEPMPPITRFTWVNVWATWCAPCLEEMGMLREWDQQLDQQSTPVDLVFLSVDSSPDDLVKFKATHPDMPDTLRAKNAPRIQPWLASLGIDSDASLPIHMLVGKDGTLECVRAGMMGKQYFDVIKEMAAR